MTEDQIAILRQKLVTEFVPELPPLLDRGKPEAHRDAKNVARAFNGYAIQKIAGLDTVTAAKSVVDDFEDNGIDAIYYHQHSQKLFLIQGKLKADEPFSLEEANAFIKGVRDLLHQHYDRFNDNVRNREAEIDTALDEAAEIVLITARTAPLLSEHAKDALTQFLRDPGKPDERLLPEFIEFGPTDVLQTLLAERADPTVEDDILIHGYQKIEGSRVTYYGQVDLSSLVALHAKHGNALFEKNIRYSLGVGKSEVNRAILGTLETSPEEFFFLSNGVTAIAHTIDIRGPRNGGRRFAVKGLSVINGAQTIASSHHFATANTLADISAARVLFTLIQVDEGDAFTSKVTRARNHQNQVSKTDFAALDGVQERLRRELAFYGITYRYRPEGSGIAPGADVMTIEDASIALALQNPNPGISVTIKREPSKLLDSKGAEYARLFNAQLSGRQLANAVRLYQRASNLLVSSEIAATGAEKLIYRHGRFAIMWLTFSSNTEWLDEQMIISNDKADELLSAPLDTWREKVRAEATVDIVASEKGPLAFFRDLTAARPFIVKLRDAVR